MRILLASATLLTSAAFAQMPGTITGTVLTVAGTGVPVPKASVRATNASTGVFSLAITTQNGSYRLSGLAPGVYDFSVENPPFFLPFSRKDIQLQAGQTVRIDARLNDFQLNTLGDGGEQFAQLLADHPAPTGRTPRTRDGKPDLSGVWLPSPPVPSGEPPVPLSWAATVVKERTADPQKDPQTNCLPRGLTFEGLFTASRLVQTPKLLVIIDENSDPTRQIYLDGRSHSRELNPSYMGHSVGHWEGETLVVDTVGFNDRQWLTFLHYPNTEQMHVVERYRRVDLGHMEVELTFEDPGAFKKPWKMRRVNFLAPDNFELFEYVCNENNRDIGHMVKQ
jgi:hypothetical protein